MTDVARPAELRRRRSAALAGAHGSAVAALAGMATAAWHRCGIGIARRHRHIGNTCGAGVMARLRRRQRGGIK